ncbi:hypothetical protein F0562_032054 [Nyssa sinensis]|uniref:RRM domain-containing protein n=1 Tax=Nyssa sinensis TaxID=561372 RepID=A0A5J5AYI5_9ASTE|nr:hypothetical protein F0562_032054 [Nyssa sinensis]
MVIMQSPPKGANSKPEIIDYYVKTLERVLGSEKDAQMCIYDASCDTHFGFCCDIDEETSYELSRLTQDFNTVKKDYSYSKVQLWGTRRTAQMCIYHISWQSNFGFCCELDDECAWELAGVPGVLSVLPDKNFDSDNKDYGGETLQQYSDSPDSSAVDQPTNIKTKKLFVTGLSFYTSEKTLRAAFEGFGELVEVKIIMDKISKRSKGYAFIEYTTEEAASAALREMNGKIINGWMIVVDVAKTTPPRNNRSRPRPAV